MLYNFKRISGRFLFYYISENFFHDVFKLSAKNTVDSLRLPMFLNFPVLIPTLYEQTQITNFLDHQTVLIDDIIQRKSKLIELLKEKRQSIINEVVTKGLNPNAKMKESGIEWLGEIPEDWRIVRLRFLGKCQNGVSQSGDYFGTGDPFVSYGDVYKNDALPDSVKGLAESSESDKENYSVLEGDVFFTRTSETIEEIGLSSVCLSTIENAVFAGFLIRFRPYQNLLFKGYSRYFFRSLVPRVHFVKEMNLVTRASLSQELLKSLPVCLPNLDEQKVIASFLDGKVIQINELVRNNEIAIEKLKEYRQSLISEAVTGKIDVRDWQAIN
jgi:type I restriction enzyme S subunit